MPALESAGERWPTERSEKRDSMKSWAKSSVRRIARLAAKEFAAEERATHEGAAQQLAERIARETAAELRRTEEQSFQDLAERIGAEVAAELRSTQGRESEQLAQRIAHEIVNALERNDLLESGRLKIDVEAALSELSSSRSKQLLQEFYTWNHRWVAMLTERNRRTAEHTYDFIESYMPDAHFRLNQMDVVRSKRDDILKLNGNILDLGVYKGGSTRALCRIFPDKTIHGFDSFEGLPEDWSHALKGSFGDVAGALPEVPDNATLHKGWFDNTLPVWAEENGDLPISLLRIDCDIYSSTKTIFDEVGHLVRPGSWVLFDELIGYRGWQHHEYKALTEFLDQAELDVEYVAYGLTYVLTRIVERQATP